MVKVIESISIEAEEISILIKKSFTIVQAKLRRYQILTKNMLSFNSRKEMKLTNIWVI